VFVHPIRELASFLSSEAAIDTAIQIKPLMQSFGNIGTLENVCMSVVD